MNFLFAWRYFKAKKSTNAINIIAWISIVAITLGTAALVLVLSVFNGFEGLVKSLYSSFYTDLKILPVQGKMISLTQEQLDKIRTIPGINSFSLVAEEKALLQNGEYQSVVQLKGVDENYIYTTDVPKSIVNGKFTLGNEQYPSLVLGSGIENALGIEADRTLFPLVVYLPRKGEADLSNPLNSISADTITTSGAFEIHQDDFDNKYGITNLDFVKRMLGMDKDEYSGLEIKLVNESYTSEAQEDLKKLLGPNYSVQTRYEQNRSLFSVMRNEKWVIYAVLVLIMIIFSFTVISSLTMLVIEKEKDISILHALGGNKSFIQKIFLSEGILLGFIGGGVGMLLALLMAWLQIHYKLIPLQGGSFLISYFPVKLDPADFVLVGITVLIITLLSSWLPSRKAAMQEFSLRSE